MPVERSPNGFRLSWSGARGELLFERPPANVLGIEALRGMIAALRSAQDSGIRALVLRGEPHFCAGVDIADHLPGRIEEMLAAIHDFLAALLDFPAVTVARLCGACLGGGAEIALAADLRFASEDLRIGFPEIGLACFPPAAALLLPPLVGPSRAAELILTAEPLSAAQAERAGLVNRAAGSGAGVDDLVAGFVEGLLGRSPAAVEAARELLRRPRRELFARHRGAAEDAYRALAKSGDLALAVEAFLARRKESPSPG